MIYAPNVKGRTSLRYKIPVILIVLTVLFAAGSVWAHHSPSATSGMTRKFTLVGALTQVNCIIIIQLGFAVFRSSDEAAARIF